MKACEVTLLNLIGRSLFGTTCQISKDIDGNALLAEAKAQAVTILALQALTAEELSAMSSDVVSQWKKRMLMHSASNVQLLYEQASVLDLMRQNGIPCVVLKGSSVACHYPVPTQRIMGDIDLLVPPDRQAEAVRILQADGYGDILEESHHCHYTISKGKITVEVHREPNGIHIVHDPQLQERIHTFFSDALANIQAIEGIPVLSIRHQAVVLILHKLEHFLAGGLGLRQLCDWACFVKARFTPAEFESLRPTLSAFGLLEFTGVITRVACDWLSLPVQAAPWCMDYDADLAREVMEAILVNGNFGRKESVSSYGQRFFVDYSSSNRLTSFFKTIGSSCRYHWPVCERHKILMPIAPFVVGVQYLRMCVRGERPALHLVKQYRAAGPRQKLYQSLKPFQGDET